MELGDASRHLLIAPAQKTRRQLQPFPVGSSPPQRSNMGKPPSQGGEEAWYETLPADGKSCASSRRTAMPCRWCSCCRTCWLMERGRRPTCRLIECGRCPTCWLIEGGCYPAWLVR